MNSKQEKQDQFEWWITCIPDKINDLKKRLPKDTSAELDYSVHSVDILEQYLLSNFSLDEVKQDKDLWDGCASYISRVYKTNVPKSEWYIELDDDENIFFNKPSLRVVGKVNFVPHSYVTTAMDRKKGNFISTIINNHIKAVSP
jgi:hypothetical protein